MKSCRLPEGERVEFDERNGARCEGSLQVGEVSGFCNAIGRSTSSRTVDWVSNSRPAARHSPQSSPRAPRRPPTPLRSTVLPQPTRRPPEPPSSAAALVGVVVQSAALSRPLMSVSAREMGSSWTMGLAATAASRASRAWRLPWASQAQRRQFSSDSKRSLALRRERVKGLSERGV